jgi:hypothetical protein
MISFCDGFSSTSLQEQFFSFFFFSYKDCASVLLWLVTKVAREYGSKIGFKVVFAVIFSSRYFLQSKCMADLFYDMWMGT